MILQGIASANFQFPISMKKLLKLQPEELDSLKRDGSSIIGTMRNPRTRALFHDIGQGLRRNGERDALFLCCGSVKMMVGDGIHHDPRPAHFPMCLKRATLLTSDDQLKVSVSETDVWQLNPPLETQLTELGITIPPNIADNPARTALWLKTRLGYGASEVETDGFLGLSDAHGLAVKTQVHEDVAAPDLALAS